MKKLPVTAIMALSLLAATTASHAASFDDAVKAATAEIDKAKAVNYEWRDSRKLLEKAAKLNASGDSKKAMSLVAKASKQGQLAVTQAKQQSTINGPQ